MFFIFNIWRQFQVMEYKITLCFLFADDLISTECSHCYCDLKTTASSVRANFQVSYISISHVILELTDDITEITFGTRDLRMHSVNHIWFPALRTRNDSQYISNIWEMQKYC